MTDQDNLRDRMRGVIDRALSAWLTLDDALDSAVKGSEEDFVAQAIIDEFGLTMEERQIFGQSEESRVVGKWEPRE